MRETETAGEEMGWRGRGRRGRREGHAWARDDLPLGSPAPVRSAVAKQLSVSILALGVAVSPGAVSNKSLLF